MLLSWCELLRRLCRALFEQQEQDIQMSMICGTRCLRLCFSDVSYRTRKELLWEEKRNC